MYAIVWFKRKFVTSNECASFCKSTFHSGATVTCKPASVRIHLHASNVTCGIYKAFRFGLSVAREHLHDASGSAVQPIVKASHRHRLWHPKAKAPLAQHAERMWSIYPFSFGRAGSSVYKWMASLKSPKRRPIALEELNRIWMPWV
eukprot:6175681-Pleurochrysis_carterae.AAC.1